MRISLFHMFLTAIIAFISCGAMAQGYDHSRSLQIMVEGERLVDDQGRQIILRGICCGTRSKLPPFYPFEPEPDFDTALERYANAVQSLGFNVVRLLVIYEAAEPERGSYDEEYLTHYDKMVRAFADRGIYVIVDSHQDLFSRRFCGDGFPDWALPEEYRKMPQHADCRYWSLKYFTRPVAKSFDRLYSNEKGIRDSYSAFFGMMAGRYRDAPAVIGFEPMNEPFPGLQGFIDYSGFYKELFELYDAVEEAIHSVEGRYLIFTDICPLENTTGAWNAHLPRPKIVNLVLAPHYYDPGTFGISLSKGGDKWMMKIGLSNHVEIGSAWNAPVLVTEYGISPIIKRAHEYINELYAVLDELCLSGTFWEASMSTTLWNMENTSVFEPDGSIRGSAYALDRPYPRKVAGIIESFSFDPETRRFKLTWAESGSINLPSEIYLPIRLYGYKPEIHLEPKSEFSIDTEASVLSIFPLDQETRRKVIITP
jgi:endoglycosylceramidase